MAHLSLSLPLKLAKINARISLVRYCFCMDTAAHQWPQKGLISLMKTPETQPQIQASEIRKATRPQKDQSINCPRCDSPNTKFCYYNNYSLSQPRYFCKTCRRYWTAGGTLRNVPVGGGSRKNKKPSANKTTIISPPSSISSTNPPQPPSHDLIQLAYKLYHGRDLNLSFPGRTLAEPGRFGFEPAGSVIGDGFGFRELMAGPVNSGMKMHPLVDDGRLLFPFEDLKQVSMMDGSENKGVVQGQNGDSTYFWNGVMGNGGAGDGGGTW